LSELHTFAFEPSVTFASQKWPLRGLPELRSGHRNGVPGTQEGGELPKGVTGTEFRVTAYFELPKGEHEQPELRSGSPAKSFGYSESL